MVRSYSLDIMAFDGQFKAVTTLSVHVQNVDDNRPVCAGSVANLRLREDLPLGAHLHTVDVRDPDGVQLKYRLVARDG